MAFPTLSIAPSKVKCIPVDATVSSDTEGGYDLTRPRNTRNINAFEVSYYFPTADKALVSAHVDAVNRMAGSFDWTYPTLTGDDFSGQTFTVRYIAVPEFDIDPEHFDSTGAPMWNCTFKIKEK